MKIIQYFLKNSLRNFNYIVYSEKNHEAVFFDPAAIDKTIPIAQENSLIPKYLLITHNHFDHISDVGEFLDLAETQKLELADGEEFQLSDTEKIKCVYTPGHVKDHYCYFLIENNETIGVVCGDTVFNAGVGNCKNGGDVDELYETIKNVFIPLEDNVKIYPSHDYFLNNLNFAKTVDPDNTAIDEYINKRSLMNLDNEFMITSIGEEKKYNPFFRAFNKKFQNKYEKDSHELFVEFRAKRDRW